MNEGNGQGYKWLNYNYNDGVTHENGFIAKSLIVGKSPVDLWADGTAKEQHDLDRNTKAPPRINASAAYQKVMDSHGGR